MSYTIAKYLRISSEDIDLDGMHKYESDSIINQRSFLNSFIEKTPEFQECAMIELLDDGWSGTNFNRPGITQLLELARHGAVNCIIVKDFSRFARNFIEAGDYLEQIFPAWGVRFISVNDMYDSAKFVGMTGGIDIAFRNLIYEMYSHDLSEKVRSARVAINRSGKTTASYAFYGYAKDPKDKHKLIIDEESAKIVRLIFDLTEQGYTSYQIARKLNADGISTANMRKRELGAKRDWHGSGKAELWDSSFVSILLKDERYTGCHIYGKKKLTAVGENTRVSVPKDDWIVVQDAIPAIISPEQYKCVRGIIEAKRTNTTHGPRGKGLLFYRKLRCGNCGYAMTRRKSKDGYVYTCATSSLVDGFDCMKGIIRESVIVETILAVIQQQAKLAESAKRKAALPDTDAIRGEIINLRRLAAKVKTAKMALWEKQHNGLLTREAYVRESEKLSGQIEEYEMQADEFENKARMCDAELGRENRFVKRYSKQYGIETLTREIVEEFVEGVRVYAPDRIEVVLSYADEYAEIAALTD